MLITAGRSLWRAVGVATLAAGPAPARVLRQSRHLAMTSMPLPDSSEVKKGGSAPDTAVYPALWSPEKNVSRIAVCQMCSTDDVERNFAAVAKFAALAKECGASLACFPENFNFLGSGVQKSLDIAEPLEGKTLLRYRGLAKDLGIWLSLGGFQEKIDQQTEGGAEGDKEFIANCHVIIDAEGELKSRYRKLHMFDAPYVNLKESAFTKAGDSIAVANSPVGKLGVSICYDLRFPELYVALRQKGAEVILIPAAFTVPTGQAHWEVLLRARAIETQCYVVAAAQSGRHNEKRESYGHSMVVDPWGEVVARCADGEGMCVADIDLNRLREIRARMPVADHRRPEVYSGL
eukprot:TRINITY_DN491_c0_g1_i1.p1 TRINITY_DN491_c0_g1~~TRINITY_DN491_c0_g1_i1.p1  ORF type:complete len:348 (+),score=89.21 TRINITY_DN491_c0_g1_i1:185-1228(+)